MGHINTMTKPSTKEVEQLAASDEAQQPQAKLNEDQTSHTSAGSESAVSPESQEANVLGNQDAQAEGEAE